jgi:hypothetical protein
MSNETDENILIAQRTQDKFEFYIIALTFTTLGLSVQTADFGRNLFADGLELAAWASLLLSGLWGLRRLEGKPHLYKLFSLQDEYQTRAKALRKAQIQGASVIHSLEDAKAHPTAKVLATQEESLKKIEEHLGPEQDKLAKQYRRQRNSLVAGFILLVLARAYIPVTRIVLELYRLVVSSGA